MELEILISNDDDITAPGLRALIAAARPFGNVTVVAPDRPQSGMGHAISIGKPLRLIPSPIIMPDGTQINAHACTGTPADCIKLATGVLLSKKPDLILSGINHGANTSISVFYSGTMSAALEGVFEGIPAIGFSLCNYNIDADFNAAIELSQAVLEAALGFGLPPKVALNVNIPDLPLHEVKGFKFTRQAMGRWIEEFDERIDPYKQKYYWLTGRFELLDHSEDTDVQAIKDGYVSICPVSCDATAYAGFETLNRWQFEQPHFNR